MFNQIDRYIGKTVLLATFVALLAFIGIISLFTLVDEVREEKAGYVLKDAFWYLLLTLPRRGYEVLPYVVFLGSLIGVGSLASRSEIVVLRAAGVSVWRVFLSVVWPALLVLTLGAIVGEYLAPWGESIVDLVSRVTLPNFDAYSAAYRPASPLPMIKKSEWISTNSFLFMLKFINQFK